MRSSVHNLHRRIGAELSHCVENKFELQSALCESHCDREHRFKIRFRTLLAQKHHADRERDFGVDDVLCQQVLAKIVQDQREVLWIADKRGDPLEGFEETDEVFVSVLLTDFRFGEDYAVTAS